MAPNARRSKRTLSRKTKGDAGGLRERARSARRRKRERPEIIPMHKTEKERRIDEIQRWMDENLPPPGTPEWEALCNGCGKCCYDKVWEGERLLLLRSACPHLDVGTSRCGVYAERFEKEPLCMPIGAEIIEMGGLPEDCPYVEHFPGYRGPRPVNKTLEEM